jgi:hypothetical protein
MNYLKYVALALIMITLSACKVSNVTDSEKVNLLDSYFFWGLSPYASIIDSLIPSSAEQIYAIQHGSLTLPNTSNYLGSTGDTRFYNAAIYSDGTTEIALKNVTCESNSISLHKSSIPLKYFDYWPINTGPTAGDTIDWTFDYNNVTVHTDCPLPSDFDTISVSTGTDPLDMAVGGTLNWGNAGSEFLILTFTYLTYDSVRQDIVDMRAVETKLVPNSGSFSMTPSV